MNRGGYVVTAEEPESFLLVKIAAFACEDLRDDSVDIMAMEMP